MLLPPTETKNATKLMYWICQEKVAQWKEWICNDIYFFKIINGGMNICNEEILICHTSKRENVFLWKRNMPFICEGNKIRNGIRMIWEHLWWMKNLNQVLRIISSCFPFSWIWKMLFMIFPQDVFVLLIKIFSLSWNCIEKKILDLLRLVFYPNTMFSAWTFFSFNFHTNSFLLVE